MVTHMAEYNTVVLMFFILVHMFIHGYSSTKAASL